MLSGCYIRGDVRSTILTPFLATSILTGYFATTSWRGLFAYFTPDDAGNLLTMHGYFEHSVWYECASSLAVVTPAFRPLGGLYYFIL